MFYNVMRKYVVYNFQDVKFNPGRNSIKATYIYAGKQLKLGFYLIFCSPKSCFWMFFLISLKGA